MDEMQKIVLASEVFKSGPVPPDLTYNPRDIEKEYKRLLTIGGGKCISISGPSKSGKSVLLSHASPGALLLQGGEMTSIEAFFTQLLAKIGAPNETTLVRQIVDASSDSWSVGFGVPKVASLSITQGNSEQDSASTSEKYSASPSEVVLARLKELRKTVILDDFHHVPEGVRTSIARIFKGLIFHGIPVVVTTAAHNRDILEESEEQLEGRLLHLEVDAWETRELMYIARGGFAALELDDPGETVGRALAEASYGAPILMHQLCLELAVANGRGETDGTRKTVSYPPPDGDSIETFMARVAKSNRPKIFTTLLRGSTPRGTERVVRYVNGVQTDYYGVALASIQETDKMATQEAREKFSSVGIEWRALLNSAKTVDTHADRTVDPGALKRALSNMSGQALVERGNGDQALTFTDDRLYLDNAFLSFYVRWADWLGR